MLNSELFSVLTFYNFFHGFWHFPSCFKLINKNILYNLLGKNFKLLFLIYKTSHLEVSRSKPKWHKLKRSLDLYYPNFYFLFPLELYSNIKGYWLISEHTLLCHIIRGESHTDYCMQCVIMTLVRVARLSLIAFWNSEKLSKLKVDVL